MIRSSFLFCLLLSSAAWGQQPALRCGQAARPHGALAHPHSAPDAADRDDGPFIIPVVFHVIHMNGPENISEEQVDDAMLALNESFNKLNADTIEVSPEFAFNIADMEVEFRLAGLDPNGQPTNGIDRVQNEVTDFGWSGDVHINGWPRAHYLNIWVCRSLEDAASAYAYLPDDAEFEPALDGIVIQYDCLGPSGASDPSRRYILSHEVGHFLGLMHTFGYADWGECDDDEVIDTPITTPTLSGCDLEQSLCAFPIIENVQNFMNYSSCLRMFTTGQKERVITYLTSKVADRVYLWQTGNLIDTGVLDVVTGLGEGPAATDGWYAFPNPAHDRLHLRTDAPTKGMVAARLLDLAGRTVLQERGSGASFALDVSSLPAGVYLLQVGPTGRMERVVIAR